jgi:hypothetical protein
MPIFLREDTYLHTFVQLLTPFVKPTRSNSLKPLRLMTKPESWPSRTNLQHRWNSSLRKLFPLLLNPNHPNPNDAFCRLVISQSRALYLYNQKPNSFDFNLHNLECVWENDFVLFIDHTIVLFVLIIHLWCCFCSYGAKYLFTQSKYKINSLFRCPALVGQILSLFLTILCIVSNLKLFSILVWFHFGCS